MKEQNFKNHSRYVALYHGFAYTLLLAILIGAGINIAHSSAENLYSASLIFAMAVLSGLCLYFARSFALAANDRAIRAEENLRHFLLIGSPLPSGLRIRQIVALRFASDAEYPALAARAKAEKLSGSAIKASIKEWKADYERV